MAKHIKSLFVQIIRKRILHALPNSYLSQQAAPSAGCAQQAPPLSSGFSLGVQQTVVLFFGAQHDAEASTSLFSRVNLLFLSTGISVSVSIF
jgi:hypothetical protein